MCGKELGITTMTRIDIGNLIGGREDLVLADTISLQTDTQVFPTTDPTKAPAAPAISDAVQTPEITSAPTPVPLDTSPNVMDFDFNTLAKSEKNNTIQTLHEYFASVTPTNKNKYTGMFQGYNLILITAEGFSPFAVNKEKTPTLYRLANEGFVFQNFYTALWQTSTSDGEYVALTGLIPTGTRNMYNGRNNLWPLSLAHQFNQLGVASKAYHDHTYTYYQRNETHPNLGYIFKAKGNGLELEHPDVWPESDLEMIHSTVDEYVNEKQFHVYYLTVSGHMNYSFTGNMMSYKNKALVDDLPYSDDVKAYIACQMELDKALEQLIKKLEDAGVADRTVIALSADHYPYAWDKSIIDEAAGHTVEPNFEMYKNNFILWCEGMKEKVVIDKPCSSLDILPTLSNLFGLEYDSRLLMGQDILSDSPPLVILSNRSFITDKVKYNSQTGEVTKLTDEELPKDYVSNLNKIVRNKFKVSESILKNDYYRDLFQ
jgi:phosphoglycerol transferase MdoB-like AlkP superfamily enzyme